MCQCVMWSSSHHYDRQLPIMKTATYAPSTCTETLVLTILVVQATLSLGYSEHSDGIDSVVASTTASLKIVISTSPSVVESDAYLYNRTCYSKAVYTNVFPSWW